MSHASRQRLLDETEESKNWILTYADLMTLLLVFFILLFSMSKLEAERFAEAVKSFQLSFQGSLGVNSVVPLDHVAPVKQDLEIDEQEKLPASQQAERKADNPNEGEVEQQDLAIESDWERLTTQLENNFDLVNVSDHVDIGQPKDGKLNIRVKGSVLFPSGSADFNREMMPMLDAMLDVLRSNPDYRLNIQGHTDNIPIVTPAFPSNWELSAVRATTVLRYLVRGGIDPERLIATGYGDALPIVPNDTPDNRATNRRIEFILEKVK